MSETDYPNEVMEGNLKQLNERARMIKKKVRLLTFATLILYLFIGLIVTTITLFLLAFLLVISLPESPIQTISSLLLIIFLIIAFPLVSSLFDVTQKILIRVFKFPRPDEMIFAECFIMANHLTDNDRRRAIREVPGFTSSLALFVRGGFDFRRGIYAREFNLLIKGKRQIRRVLLFSEGKTAELLRSFGLSLVRNEDTMAFAFLKQFLSEVEKYGEFKERFEILTKIEKYPTVITVIFSTISLLITLYLLSLGKIPP